MAKTITIHLRPDDVNLKQMIKDLAEFRDDTNPYAERSESEIARMLLTQEVRRLHDRLCGSGEAKKATSR